MADDFRKVRSYAALLLIAIIAVVGFNVFAAPRSGANGLTTALLLTGLLGIAVLGVGVVGLAKRVLSRDPRP
ncbi:amino acid transporter [Sphingobium sp. B1D3A]|uniref:Amino acid transporter n=1 Tax=Sphingobium lignivorans TaxID=2735886 RepID=A0ABR6NCZ3_9SPHN|nr:amino acid transporter [Sphingobium lignivorans]